MMTEKKKLFPKQTTNFLKFDLGSLSFDLYDRSIKSGRENKLKIDAQEVFNGNKTITG